ncbi:methylated-DNA--[protein]-cysteine S-methyltransferase [Halomonas alkaliantarctica]|nr:methylated-DNA--[protein]-cysteine S-methyltransferase [Halomonas alkaliantarctica]
MVWDYLEAPAPLGRLRLEADDTGLTSITFCSAETAAEPPAQPHPLLERGKAQLAEYFAGERQRFDLPLAASGTPFQRRVWAALCKVPFGVTCSYGDIAAALGQPTASRAVGLANARNPLPIIVPCHRVIGASGKLIGYSGGLTRKKWLLAHESAS